VLALDRVALVVKQVQQRAAAPELEPELRAGAGGVLDELDDPVHALVELCDRWAIDETASVLATTA
jgi:hypothetical protein